MSADGSELDGLFRQVGESPSAISDRFRERLAALQMRAQTLEQLAAEREAYNQHAVARQRRVIETRRAANPEPPPPPPELPRPRVWLDWYSPTHWVTEQGRYEIIQMADQHLWETVIWCVQNIEDLYTVYSEPREGMPVALASRQWLRDRTTFRALLQDALRRQLTFPTYVADYIRHYVLGKDRELTSYQPWNDPAVRTDQAELRDFLSEPVNKDDDYGKSRRAIEF